MPRGRIYLAAVGVTLLILVAVLVAVLALNRDTAIGQQGLVIFDGERLAAPYAVAADGLAVHVNGRRATSFAPVTADTRPVAVSADNTAREVVDQAHQVDVDAGGGAAGIAAVRAFLETHPAAPAFELLDDPVSIAVLDPDGFDVHIVFELPDADARPFDEAAARASAEETAEDWSQHLEAGGGLVISTQGVILVVPPDGLAEWIEDLDAALALAGSARDAALLQLLGAPELVEDHGGTPPPLAHYLDWDATHLIGQELASAADAATAGRLAPGAARTPGKGEFYRLVFTRLNGADSMPFQRVLLAEGYRGWIYNNPVRGIRAFASTSQTGALYVVSHSSAQGLSVGVYDSAEAVDAEIELLNGEGVTQRHAYVWRERGNNGAYWIALRPQGISRYWRSRDTVVHLATCHSVTIAGAFNAREFFGYVPVTSCAIALPDTRLLWGRWSGEIGAGEFRSATLAFAQGGFHEGFRHIDGSPSDDTVLSPSVVLEGAPDIPVGEPATIMVGFDAVMDTSAPPALVVEIEGCASLVGQPSWQFEALVTTRVRADEEGAYTVRVSNRWAQSPARIHLDGNQRPEAGVAGVIPNRDDHIFAGRCVGSGVGDDGAALDPRTPAPTPTGVIGVPSDVAQAPVVTALQATLAVPVTTYTVEARDPAGGELRYEWRMEGERCGTPPVPWTQTGQSVTWSHDQAAPDRCTHETQDHVVTVTVTITPAAGGPSLVCEMTGSATRRIDNPDCALVE